MSWKDRLQKSINLTSPGGNVFIAAWKGNDRTIEKKLGVFTYPKSSGSDVQDLGSSGVTYPLTFYFSGPDNDLESNRFFESCKETGQWEIIHPLRGRLVLILVSVTEKIQPITSGNVTEFITNWIEPLNQNALRSSAQIAADVSSQGLSTNEETAGQYNDVLSLDSFSESIANEQAIENVVLETENNLDDLSSQNDEISAQIKSIKSGIVDSLSQPVFDAISTAGQIQQLIILPGLAISSIEGRVNAYSGFIESILDYEPSNNSPESKNTAAVMELSTASALVAIGDSIISGELTTRTEAISLIETISNLFNSITITLDDIQTLFDDKAIDLQYFSMSQSFSELSKLISLIVSYLLRSALDLKIEKRFILNQKKTPIQLTIENYGSLGENDSNLDFFISTNNLFNNEIRLINAGREIVVYL